MGESASKETAALVRVLATILQEGSRASVHPADQRAILNIATRIAAALGDHFVVIPRGVVRTVTARQPLPATYE